MIMMIFWDRRSPERRCRKTSLEKIILIGDHPERFTKYGLPVHPDIYNGSPLGGLYTGLCKAETHYVFVAPCDLPFASAEVLGYMLAIREDHDVVVPMRSGCPEPLYALYSKNCLDPVRELLESGNFRIFDFYPRVRVRRVSEEEWAPLAGSDRAFLNVNTMEEYLRMSKAETDDR
jgi:molybdopterin-guanine dinucleotide biosynthesis protein A